MCKGTFVKEGPLSNQMQWRILLYSYQQVLISMMRQRRWEWGADCGAVALAFTKIEVLITDASLARAKRIGPFLS